MELTERDVEYVRANYAPLEEVAAAAVRQWIADGLVPRASYVLPDGTEMFPRDLLELAGDAVAREARKEFERRYHGEEPVEEQWEGYLSGLYAVCLRHVTPETIERKSALVAELTELLESPRPDDAGWRDALRVRVDELDDLERPFAPDYDRVRFDVPPTRDSLIAEPRARYLGGQDGDAVAELDEAVARE